MMGKFRTPSIELKGQLNSTSMFYLRVLVGTSFSDLVRALLHILTVYSRQSFERDSSDTYPSTSSSTCLLITSHVNFGTLPKKKDGQKPCLSKTQIEEDKHFGGIYERSEF